MRVLITGGAGFIGSNFVRYWAEKYPHDSITVLDKLTYAGHRSSLKDLESRGAIRFVKGDICDMPLVDSLVSQTDYLINFAAETHVDRSVLDPSVFVRTNVLGTYTLLESALKHHIKRFHHISTDEVFGSLSLSSRQKFSEKTPYAPHNPYSASKAGSDHLVRAYFTTFGLDVTISNCSNNYGPYQDPEKFIPRMITNLIQGENIKVYGTGKQIRDWLYVTDHCWAIDLIIHNAAPGETFTIGGQKHLFSNLEIARKVLQIMNLPESRIEFVKDRPGHDQKYAVDWTKINKHLKWSPTRDIASGLAETIHWYQTNTSWWTPLKSQSESIYVQNK